MPTDLILYHALFSTCSQKVRYTLAMKGLSYQDRLIDLRKSEHLEDWYLAINPNGVVPALRHRDANIVDSSVICEYLDEVFPTVALSPPDAAGRARMRAWMRYFEEVPTAAIRAPSFNQLFIKELAARPEQERQQIDNRRPLRKHFYQKMGREGFSSEVIDESVERLKSCLDRVERAVHAHGPFLLGDAMTLADIVLLPTLVRMEDLKMHGLWTDRPAVVRWYATMQSQPAFAATYPPGARF